MKRTLSLTAIMLAAVVGAAEAHVGHGLQTSISQGIAHPIGGLDHVLAMFAVGLFASFFMGKTRWLILASFVVMMIAGGALGSLGTQLPLVETVIALSVVVLGVLVAMQWKLPVALATGLVGFFAIFHGFAHGVEMPTNVSSLGYVAGFVLATLVLLAIGLGLGTAINTTGKSLRIGGGALAFAGFSLLSGWL